MVQTNLKVSRDKRPSENSLDSRRHQRIKVSLPGRYMLNDEREFACVAVDMSPGGIALIAPVVPSLRERVVVYLDGIGRIDGVCVRDLGNGFAMTINATIRRREKIAEQLTWLANRQSLGIPEARQFERIALTRPETMLSLESGACIPAQVIDLSRSGVALIVDCTPATGSLVYVGKLKGHVVRILDHGIVVQFVRLIPLQNFDEDIEL